MDIHESLNKLISISLMQSHILVIVIVII